MAEALGESDNALAHFTCGKADTIISSRRRARPPMGRLRQLAGAGRS
jgi:hypothetical protein